MPTRIADQLAALAEGCKVMQVTRKDGPGAGWTTDIWELGADDVARLLQAYQELLSPSTYRRCRISCWSAGST